MHRSSRLTRRGFLQWSSASLGALGLLNTPGVFRRALAEPAIPGRKILFIFLRGGIDAVQAVIPHGDAGIPGQGIPGYLQARPTIGIAPSAAHDLNGFASLHPAAHDGESAAGPKLADIFHGTLDARGPGLAIIHRLGYANQNRSHFSSQQFWENGVPGSVNLEEGVFNRYLTAYRDGDTAMQAATLSSNQMVLMKGRTLVPVLRSVDDYALPLKVSLGTAATTASPLGSGLLGAYTQSGFDPSRANEELTYTTGRTLLESLGFFEENVRDAPYEPEPEAVRHYAAIRDRRFAGYVMDCARLLKQVDGIQITGCNQDGYDTHGSESVRFPSLLTDLSLALTALYHDLEPIWSDTVIVTLSEFGRTSRENGNRGTDHGEATCSFVLGGPVRGGVYNCDASTWSNGDLFSTDNGRYLAHRSDFRALYHELIRGHLGDPQARMEEILPGYADLAANDPAGYFQPIGFLERPA